MEDINIELSRSSSVKKELLFIERLGIVVCSKCHDKHLKRMEPTKISTLASCQYVSAENNFKSCGNQQDSAREADQSREEEIPKKQIMSFGFGAKAPKIAFNEVKEFFELCLSKIKSEGESCDRAQIIVKCLEETCEDLSNLYSTFETLIIGCVPLLMGESIVPKDEMDKKIKTFGEIQKSKTMALFYRNKEAFSLMTFIKYLVLLNTNLTIQLSPKHYLVCTKEERSQIRTKLEEIKEKIGFEDALNEAAVRWFKNFQFANLAPSIDQLVCILTLNEQTFISSLDILFAPFNGPCTPDKYDFIHCLVFRCLDIVTRLQEDPQGSKENISIIMKRLLKGENRVPAVQKEINIAISNYELLDSCKGNISISTKQNASLTKISREIKLLVNDHVVGNISDEVFTERALEIADYVFKSIGAEQIKFFGPNKGDLKVFHNASIPSCSLSAEEVSNLLYQSDFIKQLSNLLLYVGQVKLEVEDDKPVTANSTVEASLIDTIASLSSVSQEATSYFIGILMGFSLKFGFNSKRYMTLCTILLINERKHFRNDPRGDTIEVNRCHLHINATDYFYPINPVLMVNKLLEGSNGDVEKYFREGEESADSNKILRYLCTDPGVPKIDDFYYILKEESTVLLMSHVLMLKFYFKYTRNDKNSFREGSFDVDHASQNSTPIWMLQMLEISNIGYEISLDLFEWCLLHHQYLEISHESRDIMAKVLKDKIMIWSGSDNIVDYPSAFSQAKGNFSFEVYRRNFDFIESVLNCYFILVQNYLEQSSSLQVQLTLIRRFLTVISKFTSFLNFNTENQENVSMKGGFLINFFSTLITAQDVEFAVKEEMISVGDNSIPNCPPEIDRMFMFEVKPTGKIFFPFMTAQMLRSLKNHFKNKFKTHLLRGRSNCVIGSQNSNFQVSFTETATEKQRFALIKQLFWNIENGNKQCAIRSLENLNTIFLEFESCRKAILDMIVKKINFFSRNILVSTVMILGFSTHCFSRVEENYFYRFVKAIIRLIFTCIDNNFEYKKVILSEKIQLEMTLNLAEYSKINKKFIFTTETMLIEMSRSILNLFDKFIVGYNSNSVPFPAENAFVLADLFSDLIQLRRELCEGSETEVIDNSLFPDEQANNLMKFDCGEMKSANNSIALAKSSLTQYYMNLIQEPNFSSELLTRVRDSLPIEGMFDFLASKLLELFECDTFTPEKKGESDRIVKLMLKKYFTYEWERKFNTEEFQHLLATGRCLVSLQTKLKANLTPNSTFNTEIVIGFFSQIFRSVEINRENRTLEYLFPLKPSQNVKSTISNDYFNNNLDRTDANSKKGDIVLHSTISKIECDIVLKNSFKNPLLNKLIQFNMKPFCLLILLVALVMVILLSLGVEGKTLSGGDEVTFNILSAINIALSFIGLLSWFTAKMKIYWNIKKFLFTSKFNQTEEELRFLDKLQIGANILFSDRELIFYLGILIIGIISVASPDFEWSIGFQLTLSILISDHLILMAKAVLSKGKFLLIVGCFICVLLINTAFIIYFNISDLFVEGDDNNLCETIVHCFVNTLDWGIRMGGGVGDNMGSIKYREKDFWPRFAMSFTFFVLFIVLLLNVISGIILDSFADLRESTAEIDHDKENICPVCGEDKADLNRRGLTLKTHVQNVHNPLIYMHFINYVKTIDDSNKNEIESYVSRMLDNEDLQWFPSTSDGENADLVKAVREEVAKELGNTLPSRESETVSLIDRMEKLLGNKTNYFSGSVRNLLRKKNSFNSNQTGN